MKKYFLILFSAFFFSISLYAQTNIGTNFTTNTTLTVANSPYIITGTISVNAGVTVTVEKNVVIKFNSGVYLRVFGTLNAYGSMFTSSSATPTKGIWNGLRVEATGSNTGTISLDSCTVEYAVYLYDVSGQINLKKCILDNFSSHGVFIHSQGKLNIENTTIKNTNHPIYFNGPGNLKSGGGNILTGNTEDYVYLSSRRRHTSSDRDWSSDVCSSDLFRVGASGIVNISPGAKLYSFNSEITINGKIKANGTNEKPVIFDKHPNASYFYGINITATSVDTACIFKNCIFKNAVNNSDSYPAMEINAASPSFENCKFMANARNLFVTGISKPTFTNCNFYPSTILGGESYNIAIDMNANVDFTTDSVKFNAN